jgi:glycerophosphoryl diester phosphodiesterase
MLLLGHRGARATRRVTENTLASFELALEHGCDGFEFDVRRSADGVPVVCHDPKIRRLEIKNTSLRELALPTLDEVLQTFSARAFLDVELKVPGLEAQTIAALAQHSPNKGYVVSSFLPEVLTAVHALDPNAPLGFLCDKRATLPRWPDLSLRWVIPHFKLVSQELVAEIHAHGLKVMVWTVNRADDIRQLAAWGVDALISDDTELLVRTLAGLSQKRTL